MLNRALIAGLTAIVMAGGALASSDDAWQEFRAQVRAGCAALVEAPEGAGVVVEVNPFGSESYGVALVTVGYAEGGVDRMACIFDKKTGQAELTAAFTAAAE